VPAYSLLEPAVAVFVVIPIALVFLLTGAVAHAYRGQTSSGMAALTALSAAAWLAATWVAASSGALRAWSATPPPFMVLLVAIVALALVLSLSPLGLRIARSVPVWLLVAVQAFRLPLEIAMHEMAERGIMPAQMSYSGLNLDIVTGATALVVAGLARRGGYRGLVRVWNAMGLALVVNVAAVGVLSTPRFAAFGTDRLNVWIAYPPFVWLPAVMVLAALAGHLLVFRALSAQAAQAPSHR
jgi:hypothetical protein